MEGTLLKQVSLKSESKEEVKKLMLVLATSTPVTGTREEIAKSVGTGKSVETAEVGKNGKESKSE